MRKKMKDYLAAIYSPAVEPKLKKLLDRKLISEKDAEAIRKSDEAAKKKSRHPPDAMDVLERPRGRPGIHARPHRRARRRVQGMRRGHQDGEDPRLSGRDQHDRLSRKPTCRKSRTCSNSCRRSKWTATRFRPATITIAAKKDMVKRLGKRPEGILPDARHDAAEIRQDPGVGQGVHHFRHAGVSGISRRQTRVDLHRVGDSDLSTSRAGKRHAT